MENNKKTNIIQILLKRDFKHTLLRILVVLIISGFFIEILPEKYLLKSVASLYVYVFLEPTLYAFHHRKRNTSSYKLSLKKYLEFVLLLIIAIIGSKIVYPDTSVPSQDQEIESSESSETVSVKD